MNRLALTAALIGLAIATGIYEKPTPADSAPTTPLSVQVVPVSDITALIESLYVDRGRDKSDSEFGNWLPANAASDAPTFVAPPPSRSTIN
ncbi:hypothetical protein [Nocardia pseudovaccinii]|uniref:hypothetical protein n=1 Tax=Nocardia pseudovaccinii TaxID=189540 RepID=UPI0007A4ED73|nr:hypothetical protein [Nocardia pseudovaccinii]